MATASNTIRVHRRVDGADGADGSSVEINSTSVTYAQSTSGTTAPTTGWSSTVPTMTAGNYLWTKTFVDYSTGDDTTSYSVTRWGVDGADGADATGSRNILYSDEYTGSNGWTTTKQTTTSTKPYLWLSVSTALGGITYVTTEQVIASSTAQVQSITFYYGTTTLYSDDYNDVVPTSWSTSIPFNVNRTYEFKIWAYVVVAYTSSTTTSDPFIIWEGSPSSTVTTSSAVVTPRYFASASSGNISAQTPADARVYAVTEYGLTQASEELAVSIWTTGTISSIVVKSSNGGVSTTLTNNGNGWWSGLFNSSGASVNLSSGFMVYVTSSYIHTVDHVMAIVGEDVQSLYGKSPEETEWELRQLDHLKSAMSGKVINATAGLVLGEVMAVVSDATDDDVTEKIRVFLSGLINDGVAIGAHTLNAYNVCINYINWIKGGKITDEPERPNFLLDDEGKAYLNNADVGGQITTDYLEVKGAYKTQFTFVNLAGEHVLSVQDGGFFRLQANQTEGNYVILPDPSSVTDYQVTLWFVGNTTCNIYIDSCDSSNLYGYLSGANYPKNVVTLCSVGGYDETWASTWVVLSGSANITLA